MSSSGRMIDLIDEMAGSMFPATEPVEKHLPGQHDQSTHGRKGSGRKGPEADPVRSAIEAAKRSGGPMGLGTPVPSQLGPAFLSAVDGIDGYDVPMGPQGLAQRFPDAQNLYISAFTYARGLGLLGIPDSALGGKSEAMVFAEAMVMRARNESVQRKAWAALRPEDREEFVEAIRLFRDGGTVVVAAQPEAAFEILDEGRFLTQFDVGDSNGRLDPGGRAAQETALFDHHPSVVGSKRTVYGFVANDPEGVGETTDSVAQYGGVRFVLKPKVADRTTITVGDSLNTNATPIPMRGPVTDRQVMNATARVPSMFGGHLDQRWANRGTTPVGEFFDDLHGHGAGNYVEAQIHEGLSARDVAKIRIPMSAGDEGDTIEFYAKRLGIPVDWYEDDY